MADELVLKLKIETTDGGQKLEDVDKQMTKIKQNSKETTDGFKLADTGIGKMWTSFKEGASKGIASMQTLKGAIAATGIGLLIIAVAAIYEWFKKTEQGARILAGATDALGQAIKEGPVIAFNVLKLAFEYLALPMRTFIATAGHMIQVLKGKESIKEAVEGIKTDIKGFGDEMAKTAGKIVEAGKNIVGAYKSGVAWEELQDRRRDNLIKESALEAKIAQLREDASDADTKAAEKVKLLTQAKQLLNEKNKTELQDAEDKVKLFKENAERYKDNKDWNDQLAVAERELNDVRTKASNEQRSINKAMKGANAQAASEAKKLTEDEKKNQAEIQKIRNETILLSLDGRQKDLTAAQQEYATEYDLAKGNAEKQLALTEKYNTEVLAINKKYDDEQAKQDKTAQEKKDKEREEEVKKEAAKQQKILEEIKKAQLMELDADIEKNAGKLEQGTISFQEYLNNERDLKIKQVEIDLSDETQKQAAIDKIKAEYDNKDKKRKEDIKQAVIQASIQAAGTVANGVLQIEQNRLNAQKEKELSNKNLTEAQKIAITKKYAQKQKEMDMKSAIINGALAVLSGLLTKPFVPAGIIAGALAAVAAGVQIATIAKTSYGQGGWLTGPSHAQGGIALGGGSYAEGGEFIVNKNAMANPMMASQVQAINKAGNNGTTVQPIITSQDIINGVVGAIASIPVTVSEHQITLAQANVQVRESRFSVS